MQGGGRTAVLHDGGLRPRRRHGSGGPRRRRATWSGPSTRRRPQRSTGPSWPPSPRALAVWDTDTGDRSADVDTDNATASLIANGYVGGPLERDGRTARAWTVAGLERIRRNVDPAHDEQRSSWSARRRRWGTRRPCRHSAHRFARGPVTVTITGANRVGSAGRAPRLFTFTSPPDATYTRDLDGITSPCASP
jgi:hypothetical protein